MFDSVSKFSLENEPGTLKFCALELRSPGEQTGIWALEQYDFLYPECVISIVIDLIELVASIARLP